MLEGDWQAEIKWEEGAESECEAVQLLLFCAEGGRERGSGLAAAARSSPPPFIDLPFPSLLLATYRSTYIHDLTHDKQHSPGHLFPQGSSRVQLHTRLSAFVTPPQPLTARSGLVGVLCTRGRRRFFFQEARTVQLGYKGALHGRAGCISLLY